MSDDRDADDGGTDDGVTDDPEEIRSPTFAYAELVGDLRHHMQGTAGAAEG